MAKVTGIGGVFIKAKDPVALCAWYDKYLGTSFNGNSYVSFEWANENEAADGQTAFSFFKESDKSSPSEKQSSLNFRVDDLDVLLLQLKGGGVLVDENPQAYEYGKFGWCIDLEGNKIELWQPM